MSSGEAANDHNFSGLQSTGAKPMKLIQTYIKSEFYKFSKNESHEALFVELLVGITQKIIVKYYKKILLIKFMLKNTDNFYE